MISKLLFVFCIQLVKSLILIIFPFFGKRYEMFNVSKHDIKDSNGGDPISTFSIFSKVKDKEELGKIFLRDFPKIMFNGTKCPYSSNTFFRSISGFISSSVFSIACLNSSEGLILSLFNKILNFSQFIIKYVLSP
ncbi:hypothetical protein GLOIN_2v1512890 [Rhizophagus irregularis DAOM 181602=DAOM 197198]|uniref:Uncharacterized protein n=1 Tax=Rhizophagus irregularis (strain DAOM 181602 / DAOM 197198 / MUCL 43194) TaxID=747089 RepID=A0A2P4QT76_RHIID|nr:hypothetical protein GLOIN_2v1512890 [Rhizophagus irregularis DAOM 181602=DAOM 197198]POG80825.1 hypothetical protein GLOIN_2v1512890 [Rhizophagus irregularis DAOM 181602=DAOM 197198]|eukprot:XP_025187691.1 hypothetical protein GLOIN_2v1512890 [Rhizophagus irregularis DAOM 181602=DAOM 197198]